MDQNRETYYYV